MRDTLIIKQALLADHQTFLAWVHVLFDRFNNIPDISALVRRGLKVFAQSSFGVLGDMDDLEVVVSRFWRLSLNPPGDDA